MSNTITNPSSSNEFSYSSPPNSPVGLSGVSTIDMIPIGLFSHTTLPPYQNDYATEQEQFYKDKLEAERKKYTEAEENLAKERDTVANLQLHLQEATNNA